MLTLLYHAWYNVENKGGSPRKGKGKKMASNRIKVTGVLTKEFTFERPAYAGFGRMETVSVFKITGQDGKVYVWKTATGSLGMEVEAPYETQGAYLYDSDKHVAYVWDGVDEGDTFTFTASVKGESEYKGEAQTEIQRVKVTEIIDRPAKRAAEDKEAKIKAQLDSIGENDLVWTMPYRQYKQHYADCETIIDSYTEYVNEYGHGYEYSPATIKVIIRDGRLKNSGVRGKHFSNYRVEFTLNGDHTHCESFRAVCVENAIEQAKKRHPDGAYFHFEGIDTRF